MKTLQFFLLFCFVISVFSCGTAEETTYYKNFFLDDTSFVIEGEVFINDRLTEKIDFDRIVIKVEAVRDWEIESEKKPGGKFEISADVTANGIDLSESAIIPDRDIAVLSDVNGLRYYLLTFFVDGRRARGAMDPDFSQLYYYVYVIEPFELIKVTHEYSGALFGGTDYYYHYDLDFPVPGWYKIYYSKNIAIGNRAAYSSGNNTKIRAPR